MFIFTLSVLAGCQPGDTSFHNGDGNDDVVTGTSRLVVNVTELVIDDMQIGYAKSGTITLESVGDSTLKVYEIGLVSNQGGVFYTAAFEKGAELELPPTETHNITVTATLPTAEPAYGELRVRTSDPDATSVSIPLHAYPHGYVPPEDTGGDTGAGT